MAGNIRLSTSIFPVPPTRFSPVNKYWSIRPVVSRNLRENTAATPKRQPQWFELGGMLHFLNRSAFFVELSDSLSTSGDSPLLPLSRPRPLSVLPSNSLIRRILQWKFPLRYSRSESGPSRLFQPALIAILLEAGCYAFPQIVCSAGILLDSGQFLTYHLTSERYTS